MSFGNYDYFKLVFPFVQLLFMKSYLSPNVTYIDLFLDLGYK